MNSTLDPIPRPIPAVGVVCFNADGQVLLIRRGTPPRKGEWSLPGGKIEMGEAVEAAALRELREETGLDARLIGLIGVVDAIYASRHYVLIDFAAIVTGGDLRAGDDATDARFFRPEDIAGLNLWSETSRIVEEGAVMARGCAEQSQR